MIRIFNKRLVAVESGSVYVADIYCDSSDTKPTTELANGSTLTEVDTGKRYLFNEATTSWVEVSGGGGGGNPNSKETYTGTLDGLIGVLESVVTNHYNGSRTDFADDYIAGNISGMLIVDGSVLSLGNIPLPLWVNASGFEWFSMVGRVGSTISEWQSVVIRGVNDSVKINALASGTPQDLSTYATVLPYTLNLYWHEMPTA